MADSSKDLATISIPRVGRLRLLAIAFGLAALECAAVGHPDKASVYLADMPAASWSVAIVGDLQRTLPAEQLPPFFREQNDWPRERLIADMVASDVKALLIAGDLVDWGASDGSWRKFDAGLAHLHEAKVPVLPALGNHDYYGQKPRAQSNYRRRFPWLEKQTWYAKAWGSVGFIWLDSNADVLGRETWQQLRSRSRHVDTT